MTKSNLDLQTDVIEELAFDPAGVSLVKNQTQVI